VSSFSSSTSFIVDDRSIIATAAVRNDKLHRHVVSGIPERPRWREDFDGVEEEDGNYAAARANVITKRNRDETKADRQGSPDESEWKDEN